MPVTSIYRTGYWISLCIGLAAVLGFIGFCIYLGIEQGPLDYQNGWFITGAIVFVFLLLYTVQFLFSDYKRLNITTMGIEIYYKFTHKQDFVPFSDITHLRTQRIKSRQGAGETMGYQSLEIEINKDRIISIDENQYHNYKALKSVIYEGCRHLD